MPNHIRRFAAALAFIACTAAASSMAQTPASNPPGAAISEKTLTLGGAKRSYLVHDFSRGKTAPLVIVLHGGGGNSENAVRMTEFDRIAALNGLIAVYPAGTSRGGPLLTWNAAHCCAHAMEAKVDDVGFVSAIIDSLVSAGKADASRVYVTGMSNGGMMSHRLGRELSTKIAAIAPVVGAVFGDEAPPAAPVPAFIIVGAVDETIPPNGGSLKVRGLLGRGSAADRDVMPAIAQAEYWARANGCTDPKTTSTSASKKTEWTTCTSGAPVVFHSVAGNGHAWPGGKAGRAEAAQPTQNFNASEAMWAFFKDKVRK